MRPVSHVRASLLAHQITRPSNSPRSHVTRASLVAPLVTSLLFLQCVHGHSVSQRASRPRPSQEPSSIHHARAPVGSGAPLVPSPCSSTSSPPSRSRRITGTRTPPWSGRVCVEYRLSRVAGPRGRSICYLPCPCHPLPTRWRAARGCRARLTGSGHGQGDPVPLGTCSYT